MGKETLEGKKNDVQRNASFISKSLNHLFKAFEFIVGTPRGRKEWNASFMSVISMLWKEKTSLGFEGKLVSLDSLKARIRLYVAQWVSCLEVFHGIPWTPYKYHGMRMFIFLNVISWLLSSN